jgi:hypothetical protein
MAEVSRRTLLRAGAGAGVLALLPAGLAVPAQAATVPKLTRSLFAPAVGATFRVTGNGVSADAVLAEVTDLVPVLRPNDQDRFGLIFRPARGVVVPQGIYTFRQALAGTSTLFVAPVDRGLKGLCLQAIVNRKT